MIKEHLKKEPDFNIMSIKKKLGIIPKGDNLGNLIKQHNKQMVERSHPEMHNESESSIDSLIYSIKESRRDPKKIVLTGK